MVAIITRVSFWDNVSLQEYKRMFLRHRSLWKFILNFISDNKIESVIEVGGGTYSPIGKLVRKYLNIDVNNALENSIKQDFLEMDISPYVAKYDLFLSCAVIEHCKDYKVFLTQAKNLKTKFIIISFFFGLTKDKTFPPKQRANGSFVLNSYSRQTIERALEELEIKKFEIIHIDKRGDILLIKNP